MMMFLYLGLMFLAIWWVANKHLKDKFNPVLKYGAVAFIAVFIAVDVFVFIEAWRFGDIGCVEYNNIAAVSGSTLSLINGTYVSGSLANLTDADGVSYVFNESANPDALYINFTGIDNVSKAYVTMAYTGASTVQLQFYDGSSWDTKYAKYNSSMTSISFDVNGSYVINNQVRTRFYTAGTSHNVSVDRFQLGEPDTTTLYCEEDAETGVLIAYIKSDYETIKFIIGLLPYLAILCGGLMIVQFMMLWVENTYGRGD